jgi:hypothetical protein
LVQISFIASTCSRIFFKARFEHSAVALDLVLVPPATNAKQKPSSRDLIDRRDKVRSLDRIALVLVAIAAAVNVTKASITS